MPQRLSDLTLNRVALVDSPANKGARILLWKREGDGGSLLSKFKSLFGITKDGETVQLDPATMAAITPIDQAVKALAKVYQSILTTDAIDKIAAVKKAVSDFRAHVAKIEGANDDDVVAALSTAGLSLTPDEVVKNSKEIEKMDALKKALGLPETATEADVLKAIEANALAAKRGASVQKMSVDARAHYAALPDDKKAGFADMSQAEQDAAAEEAKKKPTAKSDDQVRLEKAEKTAADALAEVAKLQDKDALSDVVKRVTPLTMIGKADDIGALIHKMAKVDKAAAEQIEAIFKALNERLAKSALFTENGSSRNGITKATEEIQKLAEEMVRKDAKVSIEKARMEVRKSNPDLKKREDEERKELSRAA